MHWFKLFAIAATALALSACFSLPPGPAGPTGATDTTGYTGGTGYTGATDANGNKESRGTTTTGDTLGIVPARRVSPLGAPAFS